MNGGSGTSQGRATSGRSLRQGRNRTGSMINCISNSSPMNLVLESEVTGHVGSQVGKSVSNMAGGANFNNGFLGMGLGESHIPKNKSDVGKVSLRNATAAAGIFGKGKWSPSVNEYFKRQFLGTKKRTVKEVIR